MQKKPLIKLAWVRVFLFCLLYFLLILILGAAYNFFLALIEQKTSSKKLEEDFATLIPVIFVASIVAIFIARRWVDRKTFFSLGFKWEPRHGLAGFFLGIALLCIGSFVLYVLGYLQLVDITFDGAELFNSFMLMALVAISEELVFRGYILNNLMDGFNKWLALLLSAILFAAAHAGNPGFGILAFINIFLAGVLLGINYIFTRNLWYAILLHFSWNFFQGAVLGFKVSGTESQSLLVQQLKGKDFLTGGEFGFENSIICTALLFIASLMLAIYYSYRKKQRTA